MSSEPEGSEHGESAAASRMKINQEGSTSEIFQGKTKQKQTIKNLGETTSDFQNDAETILEKTKADRKSKLSRAAVRYVSYKMKISALILSFCGFCILYICNADWIDELIEDYLGTDYEEVAPFISSVTAGTEEFDQLVEELSRSKNKWRLPHSHILATGFFCLSLVFLLCQHKSLSVAAVKTAFQFFKCFRKPNADKEEIHTIVTEFLERKLKQFCGNKQADDVPVKLLWKGGTLMDSSIHCNIRDESSKFRHVHRHLLRSNLPLGPSNGEGGGEGGEKLTLAPSSSETSTARKMAEIRKLLESEQELQVDKTRRCRGQKGSSSFRKSQRCDLEDRMCEDRIDPGRKEEPEGKSDSDCDGTPDQKLMNRIRLLESRLRLEELKNKNWISRMSRAEGILQQLNKQVERIEETRPMGTLTKTLKITSTVTNWAPSARPRGNMQFTLVNQYPPFCMQTPYMSLSELIKKEVGLPTPIDNRKSLFQLPPTPQIHALPSPIVMPQSSFLSKFLCR